MMSIVFKKPKRSIYIGEGFNDKKEVILDDEGGIGGTYVKGG